MCLGQPETHRLLLNGAGLMPPPWAKFILATFHPSSVLRVPKPEDRKRMKSQLLRDLKIAIKSVAYD
jgi:hypothetical protein